VVDYIILILCRFCREGEYFELRAREFAGLRPSKDTEGDFSQSSLSWGFWLPVVAVPEEAGCAFTSIRDRRASSRSWDLFRIFGIEWFFVEVYDFFIDVFCMYVYIYMSS
jgi:hypothetical protein